MRQEKRSIQIRQIQESIEKSEEKADFNKVVLATMANLGLGRQTARDYVEIAFHRLGIEK